MYVYGNKQYVYNNGLTAVDDFVRQASFADLFTSLFACDQSIYDSCVSSYKLFSAIFSLRNLAQVILHKLYAYFENMHKIIQLNWL